MEPESLKQFWTLSSWTNDWTLKFEEEEDESVKKLKGIAALYGLKLKRKRNGYKITKTKFFIFFIWSLFSETIQ